MVSRSFPRSRSTAAANFLWSYTLSTDSAEMVNTGVNASFFTLYDLHGLVPGSAPWTPNAIVADDLIGGRWADAARSVSAG